MSFPLTIALTATEHASTVPVVDPGSASGIFSLTWLVIALPLAGAAIRIVADLRGRSASELRAAVRATIGD